MGIKNGIDGFLCCYLFLCSNLFFYTFLSYQTHRRTDLSEKIAQFPKNENGCFMSQMSHESMLQQVGSAVFHKDRCVACVASVPERMRINSFARPQFRSRGTLATQANRGAFDAFTNLVPRASFPLTSGRKTRALCASISGMRHRYHGCRLRTAQWNRMCRIRFFPLLFQNSGCSCSQSSRFPTAGQGERSSGNELEHLPYFYLFRLMC